MSSIDVLGEEGTLGAGGPAALGGFIYQAAVSAWVALDLILRTRSTDSVELEPADQEDIAADLRDDNSAPVVGAVAQVAVKKLVIQVKRRSGDAWTPTTLATLLSKGTNRISASKRLEDRSVHYLLITNESVNGDAKGNSVRGLGSTLHQKPADLLPSHDDPDVSKRISVLAGLDWELLETRVRELLITTCKVPVDRWNECFKLVYDESLARMARPLDRHWTRSQLEKVVRDHGGYLAASAELDIFVKPSNWAELLARLQNQNAIVIHGTSGTGKTLTAKALKAEMRARIPGLIVAEVREPHEVDLYPESPTLYFVDDPWGQNGFEVHRAAWTEKLPIMFRDARPQLKFIVTTRDDVLHSARAEKGIRQWLAALQRDQYNGGQWEQMYLSRLELLPPPQQALALDYRGEVQEQLNSPYEMQVFFDELRSATSGDATRTSRQLVQDAVLAAHRSSIEHRIENHVRESKREVEAICLWGLFAAHTRVSYSALEVFAGHLCDINEAKYGGIERLANSLSAGRRLRQNGDVLSYHHPSVEAGLRRLVTDDKSAARRVMADVVRALIRVKGAASDGNWGPLGAARAIAAASNVDGLQLKVPDEVSQAVDAWLAGQLTAGDEYETQLFLAAEAGSNGSVVRELAQLLTSKLTYSVFAVKRARPVEISDEEVARLRGGALTRRMVERYIADVLPYKNDSFRPGMAALLKSIAGETDEAYATAAETTLAVGMYASPTEQIFPSAFRHSARADRLTITALDAYDSLGVGPDLSEWDEYENGWYDENYEEHWNTGNSEEWQLLDEWLLGYVDHARRNGGWRELARKNFAPRLAGWWMQSASREKGPALLRSDEEEFKHLLAYAAADVTCEVRFWSLATAVWYDCASDHLVHRLVEGADTAERIEAAISCLLAVAPTLYERVEQRMLAEKRFSRLFELFVELMDFAAQRHVQFDLDAVLPYSDEERERIQNTQENWARLVNGWVGRQSEPFQEILSAINRPSKEPLVLSDEARDLLGGLKPTTTLSSLRKLEICARVGCVDPEELALSLNQAPSADVAEKLVRIAAQSSEWSIVDAALGHRFAKAQAAAIAVVVERDPAALSLEILALGRGRSKYVKRALLKAISEHPFPQYLDALVEMTRDRWLGDDPDGTTCYPHARTAARHIGMYGELSGAIQSELLGEAGMTDDPELRDILFDCVIAQGAASGRRAVLDQVSRKDAIQVANAAARACVGSIASFTAEDLQSVTVEQVKKSGVFVASALMILLGRFGSAQAVEGLALHISQQPYRRVFLVLLLAAMEDRGELFLRVQKLLPAEHAVHAIFAGTECKLPRTLLDDLGSVRNVRIVLDWLDPMFEKVQADPASWMRTDGPIDEGYEGA